MVSIARPCYDEGFNHGHFESGVFIPDCKRCALCCIYEFRRIKNEEDYKEYEKFDEYHGWKRVGNILMLYVPCKMLEGSQCAIHEERDRPEPCKRFGFGDYFHPKGCAFQGGKTDEEVWGKA